MIAGVIPDIEIVEELPVSSEESLRALLAERDLEIRRLKVSHGRTFEELTALGAVGGGAAYRFEELVAIRDGSAPAATVPPWCSCICRRPGAPR